ncbi:MAG: hypothetical protein JJE52_06170 [Acidimicrobiia bacterium]|nr:hypothetical protein [Acidimicrobiia bacterium]
MLVHQMTEGPRTPTIDTGDQLAVHSVLATAALRTVLAAEGIEAADAEAVVVGNSHQLLVTLFPGTALDPKVGEMAAVRVLAAVRALDPGATIIDVSLRA